MKKFSQHLNEGYNDNRTGFAKRRREDDEYHVPDPVTRTHKITHTVSHPDVEGGKEHKRTVTISNSNRTPEEAKHIAKTHLKNQGYKIHEEVIAEGAYEKAEENKRSADAAKKQGDMFAHHLHMADHHDNMAEWHGSKGRHGEADKHAEKAEQHHEKAMALKEEVELDEEAKGHTIEAHGIKGTKGTPWRKTFKSHEHLHDWAEKNDSVEVHGTRDLQKSVKEEAELDEARMTAAMKLQKAFQREQEKSERERKAGEDLMNKNKEKPVQEGLKPEHNMRPGWMLKADPELAKKVADNKKKFKSFKDTVGKKIENK